MLLPAVRRRLLVVETSETLECFATETDKSLAEVAVILGSHMFDNYRPTLDRLARSGALYANLPLLGRR